MSDSHPLLSSVSSDLNRLLAQVQTRITNSKGTLTRSGSHLDLHFSYGPGDQSFGLDRIDKRLRLF